MDLDPSQEGERAEIPYAVLLTRYEEAIMPHRAIHAIADISLNELTVHFLGSTKFEGEGEYRSLEQKLLASTK
jgi:hypothetical protein